MGRRNDPRQYDELSGEWWDPRGRFAMLQWIVEARAALVPPAPPGGVLVDVACGGGLLAPHLDGWRHVGVDLSAPSLRAAREHGVAAVRGDVARLPIGDEVADCVVAGEVLEHVADPEHLVAEACRILRPGGTLVVDTIAATRRARLLTITVAEHVPGGPPRHLHDPRLYVDSDRVVEAARRNGVTLSVQGLRLGNLSYLGWLTGTRPAARMVPSRSRAVLYQAHGRKA